MKKPAIQQEKDEPPVMPFEDALRRVWAAPPAPKTAKKAAKKKPAK